MTEQEWLASRDPMMMLEFITRYSSRRKQQLFAVGCCRRLGALLCDQSDQRLVLVERAADTPISDPEWSDLNDDAMCLADGLSWRMGSPEGSARWNAANAVWSIIDHDAISVVLNAARAVEDAARDPVTFDVSRPDPPSIGDPVERAAQSDLLRHIVGNPFVPASIASPCLTPTVVSLASAAYQERHWRSGEIDCDRLGVLSDALEEASCDDAALLDHLRGPGPHVRGCWALDLLLGRE